MAFSRFQTAEGVLKKLEADDFGNNSVIESLSVDIDPTFGFRRAFDRDGEVIDGVGTVISGSGLGSFFDESHPNYTLEYKGKEWRVEKPIPFYKIGTSILEHLEVVLR